MAVRSSSLLIAVAAAVATFLLLSGGKSDEQAAQVPPLPLEGVEQRITPEGLGEHLDALQRIANENDGTRATGTSGERATADYIAGRLRAAGYRVQVQEVRQRVFRERSSPRLIVPGRRQYEVVTLRFSGSGSVAGTVRKTGSGCARASFNSLQRGEIALVRRGGCPFRTKVLGAQRAGAAAVIVSDPDPVRGSLERAVRIPAIAVGDRGAGLTGKRVRVRVQAETTTYRAPNVLAESGVTGAPRVVMAGGHLDSVPAGPGLNDNGSGVAAVLELAEELGGRPLPEGTALRFGFWGAEEIGLVGSTYYVDQLSRAERRRIAAYVNLDMVGSPGAKPSVYTGNARIARALRRTLGQDAPNITLGGSSDHAPFDEAGIPTGGIFTGLDNCYHQRCDTVENVDRTLATTASRAAGAALVELLRP